MSALHTKTEFMSSIDSQIQEILLRSSPVNDNSVLMAAGCRHDEHQSLNNIHVVGNNNIVVSSGLWILYFFIGLFYVWLQLLHS